MAQHAIVQSIKTITESLIRKAGFDKTRSGKVVGVNSLTNTYSVKVDGHTYNNVRVVNDATYNVGDTVKVNIPVNQMSQAYISASIFSDASIGKKIGHAESLINAIDGTLEDITEIDGHIYQLDITSVYEPTQSVHTGHIYKDGVDVTDASYWNRFRWYLMTSTGKERQTSDVEDDTLTLPIAKYLYGMVLILEWVDENEGVILRKQTTLIDNSEIASVETTASNAYSIATNTDQYFWVTESSTDNGAHVTQIPKEEFIASSTSDARRGGNALINSDGFAVRYGYSELAQFTYDKLTFNALNNGVLNKNMELTPNSLTFYDGTTSGIELAKFNGSGMVLKNSSGYKTTESGNNGFVLYDGTSSENELASFRSSGSVIGKDGETRLIMDFHSLKMKDSNDITYFDVEDLRDAQGEFSLTRNFVGDGVTDVFMLTSDLISRIESITSVEIDSVTMPSTDYTLRAIDFDYYIDFNNPPSDGSNIKVVCITKNDTVKIYTAGIRGSNNVSNYGFMSFAEGYKVKASGDASHAEGYISEATDSCAHAEGFATKAYGEKSHAEGNETQAYGKYSHSEGYLTKAYRDSSHAEGGETQAYSRYSHSGGYLTTAAGISQTVIGMYNHYDDGAFTKTTDTSINPWQNYYAVDRFGIMQLVENPDVSDIQNYYELDDFNGKYAFIIGNGVFNPSNALTVDWDGNINASGSFYGNIPSAKFYGGASGNLSVTTGNFYALNQFPNWSHGTNIYDSNVFAGDNNGLTLKKSGVYYFSAQAHFNASASGDWIMMHLYDYDAQTVLSGATYGYQNNGFCNIWLNEIVNVTDPNHRIILRYGRYSGSADFRPTWVRLNAILLKPTS